MQKTTYSDREGNSWVCEVDARACVSLECHAYPAYVTVRNDLITGSPRVVVCDDMGTAQPVPMDVLMYAFALFVG